MSENLIDELQTRGHWRVNFRPVDRADLKELSLAECMKLVTEQSVSLRGWDYPHIPRRVGERQGVTRMNDHIEAWADWEQHREFWRMYSSSQFLHYRALGEQWMDRSSWREKAPSAWGHPIEQPVGVTTNLWLLVEIFEFIDRLHNKGLYEQGVSVDIQLRSGLDQGPRILWIDDAGRAPFSYDRSNGALTLSYQANLSPGQIRDVKGQAIRVAVHFFEKFGWTPSEEHLTQSINELYGS